MQMTKPRMRNGTAQVKNRSGGLSALALSFVLPHESRPIRLPVVPAAFTALLEVMSDGTLPITDNTSKMGFLCRDPAYPLWMDKILTAVSCYISAESVSLHPVTEDELAVPNFTRIDGGIGAGATIDGRSCTLGEACDLGVVGISQPGRSTPIFIPALGVINVEANCGGVGGGSGIQVDLGYMKNGEEQSCTVLMVSDSVGFKFSGYADSSSAIVGSVLRGVLPVGFTWVKAWRTTASLPTATASCVLALGWSTGGILGLPTTTRTLLCPYSMPPEFANSTLPYSRTRLNSSAVLITNVTAALSKEGTVLAGRLKPSVVDPWSFTPSHLNSVHPKLRYFGPLEKGLYTFTTPSGNVDDFGDHWTRMFSNSVTSTTNRPLFNYTDVGVYNGFFLSDLGSAGVGTQLAVSCYAHLEFEATSALFSLGVSHQTLESLHATEVALLQFGHFHENPLHWAALRAAVMKIASIAAPMIAPYVHQAGTYLLNKGVSYLSGAQGGDRTMQQATLNVPRIKPRTRQPAKAKSGTRRKTKK